MGASLTGLALLLLLSLQGQAAPVVEDGTDLQDQDSYPSEGCYYNFEHYEEGDRIVTNEPCLNCTCHNHMLMCYLRVCPFTKAIGQDCTVEKRPDQCCPIITCPEVPVQLLTSSTTQTPTTASTAVGRPDNYGCTLSDNTFYPDGAQVPSDPRKPCELCYCIRNRTACVMQECTLQVEGCQPVYQQGICCPVRYDCDYDSVTTPGTTIGLVTTPGGPSQCLHDGVVYNDGEMVEFKGKSPCEHCYCMRGDVVCAVQECGTPLQAPDCVPLPAPPGHCCPDTFQCANGTVPLEALLGKPESQDDSHSSEVQSAESESSKEPTNDSAAEGSESSEEQKQPQDTVSEVTSSPTQEDSLNKGQNDVLGEVQTVIPVGESAVLTEKPHNIPSDEVLSDNEVQAVDSNVGTENYQEPLGSDKDAELDKKIAQDNFDNNNQEPELNVIHEDHDKPDNFSPDSIAHDKPVEVEDNADLDIHTKPNDSQVNENSITTGDLPQPSVNQEPASENVDEPIRVTDSQNTDNVHSDAQEPTTIAHDADNLNNSDQENALDQDVINKTGVEEHVSAEGPASNQHDSDETMVTGDQEEDHKQTTIIVDDDKTLDNNVNMHSMTESSVSENTEHSTKKDSHGTEISEKPVEDSIQIEDDSQLEITDELTVPSAENEMEKNKINTNAPETYTEVSVETVEVHTSTPEINAHQSSSTSQTNLIDHPTFSTEGPEAGNQYLDQNLDNQNEDITTTHDSSNIPTEHDSTTVIDTGNIARVPGEGNCVIDAHTYKHNSEVHTSNACQISCKCLNSIVHCKLVECPPPPTQYANCMPLQEPDSCCPSYTCDDKPSLPLESHSQVSTEYPNFEGDLTVAEPGEIHDGSQNLNLGHSDQEEPSHDQAHSSLEGSELAFDDYEKPDTNAKEGEGLGFHESDDSSSHEENEKPDEHDEHKPVYPATEHVTTSDQESPPKVNTNSFDNELSSSTLKPSEVLEGGVTLSTNKDDIQTVSLQETNPPEAEHPEKKPEMNGIPDTQVSQDFGSPHANEDEELESADHTEKYLEKQPGEISDGNTQNYSGQTEEHTVPYIEEYSEVHLDEHHDSHPEDQGQLDVPSEGHDGLPVEHPDEHVVDQSDKHPEEQVEDHFDGHTDHSVEHPQHYPEEHIEDHTVEHPLEHPEEHVDDQSQHPLEHPEEHVDDQSQHPLEHPQEHVDDQSQHPLEHTEEHVDDQSQHPLEHTEEHVDDHSEGHIDDHSVEHPEGQAEDHSIENPQEHTEGHIEDHSVGRPEENIEDHADKHPQEHVDDYLVEHPEEQVEDHPAEHPQEHTEGNIVDHSQEQVDDHLVVHSEENVENHPVEHPEEHIKDPAVEHPQEQTEGSILDHAQEHVDDHSVKRPQEHPEENSVDHSAEHPHDHPEGHVDDHSAEHPQEHAEDHSVEQPEGHQEGHSGDDSHEDPEKHVGNVPIVHSPEQTVGNIHEQSVDNSQDLPGEHIDDHPIQHTVGDMHEHPVEHSQEHIDNLENKPDVHPIVNPENYPAQIPEDFSNEHPQNQPFEIPGEHSAEHPQGQLEEEHSDGHDETNTIIHESTDSERPNQQEIGTEEQDSISHVPFTTSTPMDSNAAGIQEENDSENNDVIESHIDQEQESIDPVQPGNDKTFPDDEVSSDVNIPKDSTSTNIEDTQPNEHIPDQANVNQISNNEVIHQTYPILDESSKESSQVHKPSEIPEHQDDTIQGDNAAINNIPDGGQSENISDELISNSEEAVSPGSSTESSEQISHEETSTSGEESMLSSNENDQITHKHPSVETEQNNVVNEISNDQLGTSPQDHEISPDISETPDESGQYHEPESGHTANNIIADSIKPEHQNQEEENKDQSSPIQPSDTVSAVEGDNNAVHNEIVPEIPVPHETTSKDDSQSTDQYEAHDPSNDDDPASNETFDSDGSKVPSENQNEETDIAHDDTSESSKEPSNEENINAVLPDTSSNEEINTSPVSSSDNISGISNESELNSENPIDGIDKSPDQSHKDHHDNDISSDDESGGKPHHETIEDGVGGIVSHETPNEIEPIFVGEDTLPHGISNESSETQDVSNHEQQQDNIPEGENEYHDVTTSTENESVEKHPDSHESPEEHPELPSSENTEDVAHVTSPHEIDIHHDISTPSNEYESHSGSSESTGHTVDADTTSSSEDTHAPTDSHHSESGEDSHDDNISNDVVQDHQDVALSSEEASDHEVSSTAGSISDESTEDHDNSSVSDEHQGHFEQDGILLENNEAGTSSSHDLPASSNENDEQPQHSETVEGHNDSATSTEVGEDHDDNITNENAGSQSATPSDTEESHSHESTSLDSEDGVQNVPSEEPEDHSTHSSDSAENVSHEGESAHTESEEGEKLPSEVDQESGMHPSSDEEIHPTASGEISNESQSAETGFVHEGISENPVEQNHEASISPNLEESDHVHTTDSHGEEPHDSTSVQSEENPEEGLEHINVHDSHVSSDPNETILEEEDHHVEPISSENEESDDILNNDKQEHHETIAPSSPESESATVQPIDNSYTHQGSTESTKPDESANTHFEEVSHHEDNVSSDLASADHHIEDQPSTSHASTDISDHHETSEETSSGQIQENAHDNASENESVSDASDLPSDAHGEEEPNAGVSDHTIPENIPESSVSGENDSLQSNIGVNEEHDNSHEPQVDENKETLQDNEKPINGPSGSEADLDGDHHNLDHSSETEVSPPVSTSQEGEIASAEMPSTDFSNHDDGAATQEEIENKDSSSPETGHDGSLDGSEAAFPVEEHGSSTTGFADSDAIVNAVYAVVHEQEGSSDVGDSNKPSHPETDSNIHEEAVPDHEIDQDLSHIGDMLLGHEGTVPSEDSHHQDMDGEQNHPDYNVPMVHETEQDPVLGHDIAHSSTSQPEEHVEHSTEKMDEHSNQPEDTSENESQGLIIDHGQTDDEHKQPISEEIGEHEADNTHKESAHPDEIHHDEVGVSEDESGLVNEADKPVKHTPVYNEGTEDKIPSSVASENQPESSTESIFTTVMQGIFGSNLITPEQPQIQEQPGSLFQNWSQKPSDHVTTTKQPQTVPHIPEDSQYPYEQEQDDYEDDSSYSPGTCRYGGKVYLSAQQIPRDDPCDFCFCFRSDIICLQQSCPPPIQHCYQENIPGFCCPRYECHVSMATMVNLTTTTTTTTTTLPPHFLAHAYKGAAKKTGCQVKGVAYRVGERISSTSGPCLECRCGADGQMKCDPTICNPQETLLRQVMDAAVISRRRRHIMTTPYFTARRLR